MRHDARLSSASAATSPTRAGNSRARCVRISRLPRMSVVAVSPAYVTAPIGCETPQPDYVNAVIEVENDARARGRCSTRCIRSNAAREGGATSRRSATPSRTLDIDLLLYGRRRMRVPGLTVPHPRMHQRAFVLRPLVDIAAVATIPGRGLARRFLPGVRDQRIARTRSHLPR